MRSKQLFALFVCSLVVWTTGNGLLPLLPVYVRRLGAAPAAAGYYMSFAYLALASGTLAAGWLSDRLQRRRVLLIGGGLALVPAAWLMGRAANIWQLTALTTVVWFLAGMELALANILAGLFAEQAERGRVFGILSMTSALGALLGGAATGPIADRWGYPALFASLAGLAVCLPLAALLVEDKVMPPARDRDGLPPGRKHGLGRGFTLLFLASLAVALANFMAILGRSLLMNDQGFRAAAISSTAAISGAVVLPLPPVLGWLSDRFERKRLLGLCYLAGTAGMLVLPASASLWHFWLVIVLMRISSTVGIGLGSALVTDMVPTEVLGRRMSLFNATSWIGGILGFAGTGLAIEQFGLSATFRAGALLPLLAILLVAAVRQSTPAPHSGDPHAAAEAQS
jgi:MFS family permease